jgi:hypothetical protein
MAKEHRHRFGKYLDRKSTHHEPMQEKTSYCYMIGVTQLRPGLQCFSAFILPKIAKRR